MSVIRKSVLAAIVMLVAYHFALPHLSRKFYQINGLQRGNYARAQHYLYDIPDKTNVIVGSSMSMELNDKTLGPGYFKFGLPGGSVSTPLEIILRSGKRPPLLLVETNVIAWNVDHAFVEDLFSPWLFQLRRHSMIFREDGRPSNFVVGIAEACVRKACLWNSRPIDRAQSDQASSAPRRLDDQLFAKVLGITHEIYEHASPETQASLAQNAAQLGDIIDLLSGQGCKCIFFEMPIDASLMDLPLTVATRKAVTTRLPADKYSWLHFARDHNYETIDGIHLIRPEADRVTKVLLQQVDDVVQQSGQTSPHFRALALRRDEAR